MFCARLFICALWSPAGKGLTSWLSFVVSSVSLSLSNWYPGSGVVLDCIDSWSLQPYYFGISCFWTYYGKWSICSFGANVPFSITFSKVFEIWISIFLICSMLSENRKWCHDLKIAYGVKSSRSLQCRIVYCVLIAIRMPTKSDLFPMTDKINEIVVFFLVNSAFRILEMLFDCLDVNLRYTFTLNCVRRIEDWFSNLCLNAISSLQNV